MAELAVPGAKLPWVARRNGVAPALLYRWRKELVPDPTATFVPMIAPPTPVETEPPAMMEVAPPKAASPIEIILANGRAVRVSADVDTAALVRIVAALEGAE